MENSTIRILVLENGLPLMGEVEEAENGVTITHPVIVMAVPLSETSRGGVSFSPFMEFTEDFRRGMFIPMKRIMMQCSPVQDLEKKYREIFSRLILP